MKASEKVITYFGFALLCLFGFSIPLIFVRGLPDGFFAPKQYWTNLFSLALFFLFTTFLKFRNFKIDSSPLSPSILAWFSWCAFSIFWNYNSACGLRELGDLALIVLFFFYAREFVPSVKGVRVLFLAMTVSGVFITGLNFMEGKEWYYRFDLETWEIVYATPEFYEYRDGQHHFKPIKPGNQYLPFFPDGIATGRHLGATTGNKNNLASVQAFLIFLPLSLFLASRGWIKRTLYLSAVFILLAGSFFLASAGGIIGILIGFVFFIALALITLVHLQNVPHFRKNLLILFWGGILGAVLLILLGFNPINRFKILFDSNAPFLSRLTHCEVAINATFSSFHRAFYGFGFGSFKHFFPLEAAKAIPEELKDTLPDGIARHAHSDWIQLLSELGIVGMFLSLYFLYVLLSHGYTFMNRVSGQNFSLPERFRKAFRIVFFIDIFAKEKLEFSQNSFPETSCEAEDYEYAEKGPLLLGSLSGIAAILGNALGDFPLNRIAPRVYFAIALGIAAFLIKPVCQKIELLEEKSSTRPRPIPILLVVLTLLAVPVGIRGTYFRFQSDRLAGLSDAVRKKKDPKLHSVAAGLLYHSLNYDSLPGYTWLKLSTLMETMENYPLALVLAQQSLKNINLKEYSYSDHSVFLIFSNILYEKMKNPEKALVFAEKGLYYTFGYDRCIFYYYAINSYIDLGKPLAAEALLAKWFRSPHLKKTNLPPQSVEKVGYYFGTRKNWEKTAILAKNFLEAFPNDFRLLRLQGNAFAFMGKKKEALSSLEEAYKAQPGSLIVQRDLGVAHWKFGDQGKGRELLEKLIADPKFSEQLKGFLRNLIGSN